MTARISLPTEANIEEAVALLRAGAVVAFPTETVYGLGADATADAAVARVYATKDRPRFNPLIVHVGGIAQAATEVSVSALGQRLAARFWPGPLTLVLPRRASSRVSLLAGAGLDSLAVRAPDHPVAQALIAWLGRPLVAPSANRSGRVSPTTAAHVATDLGEAIPLILDGGACRLGLESTVIDLTTDEPALLRPGALARTDIERITGPLRSHDGARINSPGLLASHYAPARPLRLNVATVESDEALLAFGPSVPAGACRTLNLSVSGDTQEAAAHLFSHLRALDAPPARAIAVMPIPDNGLGEAINDRLRRAAAPRHNS